MVPISRPMNANQFCPTVGEGHENRMEEPEVIGILKYVSFAAHREAPYRLHGSGTCCLHVHGRVALRPSQVVAVRMCGGRCWQHPRYVPRNAAPGSRYSTTRPNSGAQTTAGSTTAEQRCRSRRYYSAASQAQVNGITSMSPQQQRKNKIEGAARSRTVTGIRCVASSRRRPVRR